MRSGLLSLLSITDVLFVLGDARADKTYENT